VIIASTLGIGALFPVASVFADQGFVTVAASTVKSFLVPGVIAQMSAVGGPGIVTIFFNGHLKNCENNLQESYPRKVYM
jgi:uncharacterized membrane protein YqgA involved in biofilm formation